MQRVREAQARESQAQENQPVSHRINDPSRSRFVPAAPSNRIPWDRVIISSSIAAILAVAVTLGLVSWLRPNQPQIAKTDPQIGMLTELLKHDEDVIHKLEAATRPTAGLNFVEMTGNDQPQALGRVFIDADDKKWYFFTSGMKPAPTGKTYELWMIAAGQKLPAGTFEVNADGSATLLGNVPSLPSGSPVTVAVTDEPAGGVTVPTGQIQILGTVQ
jgi:anti-sigma-K factor RskA